MVTPLGHSIQIDSERSEKMPPVAALGRSALPYSRSVGETCEGVEKHDLYHVGSVEKAVIQGLNNKPVVTRSHFNGPNKLSNNLFSGLSYN